VVGWGEMWPRSRLERHPVPEVQPVNVARAARVAEAGAVLGDLRQGKVHFLLHTHEVVRQKARADPRDSTSKVRSPTAIRRQTQCAWGERDPTPPGEACAPAYSSARPTAWAPPPRASRRAPGPASPRNRCARRFRQELHPSRTPRLLSGPQVSQSRRGVLALRVCRGKGAQQTTRGGYTIAWASPLSPGGSPSSLPCA